MTLPTHRSGIEDAPDSSGSSLEPWGRIHYTAHSFLSKRLLRSDRNALLLQYTSSIFVALAILAALSGCTDVEEGGQPDSLVGFDFLFADNSPGDTGDAMTTDTTVNMDAGPEIEAPTCDSSEERPFLCPCDFNVQCESGYCIAVDEDEIASRCTETCFDSCEEGWQCRPIAGGADPVYICVPVIDTLCDPCFTDLDCQNLGDVCLQLADGTFCGRYCEDDPDACPVGFSCVDSEGGAQCVPQNDSCLCPPPIDLNVDPANCGTCGHECNLPHASVGCKGGACFVVACDEGWTNLDGMDANGCEYECGKTSDDDEPDPDFIDANCDGIDGEVDHAIFVSSAGKNSNPGTREEPVLTIKKALTMLQTTKGKEDIYLSSGVYPEQVRLDDGAKIYGGYSADGLWDRNTYLHETIITWDELDELSAIRVVIFEEIADPTILDGVTLQAGTNPLPGGSSYGAWFRVTSSEAELRYARIVAGNGAGGNAGSDGFHGVNGVSGAAGKATDTTDCNCNEFESYGGKGGAGAEGMCVQTAGKGAGGLGADGGCGDDNGNQGAGAPGGTGGGGAEAGGANGSHGEAGQAGSGGSAIGIVLPNGGWMATPGTGGGDGFDGLGGGGGGSGDGHDGGWLGCASWGGGGGGGGSAGCAGSGALGGGGGGGSFGIFLVDASPTLIGCTLSHKSGGHGGPGGTGGSGGTGKPGGPAGSGNDKAGSGGSGGQGGTGGAGGHGGGGAGGAVYGLYLSGNCAPACSELSFEPLGVPGTGGAGGNGLGNPGAPGQTGDINLMTPTCKVDTP